MKTYKYEITIEVPENFSLGDEYIDEVLKYNLKREIDQGGSVKTVTIEKPEEWEDSEEGFPEDLDTEEDSEDIHVSNTEVNK